MVATKREFIFFTVVLSGLATSMLVTSFATTSWLTGTLRSNPVHGVESSGLLSTISYGLFHGTLVRVVSANTDLQLNLNIACLTEHNACVWSCQPTSESRQAEAILLWTTGCLEEVQMIKGCTQFQGNVAVNTSLDGSCERADLRFMNAGLRASTILFLSLSLLMAVACVAFAVYNSAFNPVQTYLGVPGLYIWNSCAVLLNLTTLVLWGVQFGSLLQSNVAYTEVITGGFSNNSVSLGFSYWLVMAALFFHAVNLVLLYLRQYLMDHETPPASSSKLDGYSDGLIYMY